MKTLSCVIRAVVPPDGAVYPHRGYQQTSSGGMRLITPSPLSETDQHLAALIFQRERQAALFQKLARAKQDKQIAEIIRKGGRI